MEYANKEPDFLVIARISFLLDGNEKDGNILCQGKLTCSWFLHKSQYRMFLKLTLQDKNLYYFNHFRQRKQNFCQRKSTDLNNFFSFTLDKLKLRALKSFSDRKPYVCLLNEQFPYILVLITHIFSCFISSDIFGKTLHTLTFCVTEIPHGFLE